MEIRIGFEGPQREVRDFIFDLFEAHKLQEGLEKATPGDTQIVMGPLELRKGAQLHVIMEVALWVGQSVAVPLFVSWLYDKWKKGGEKSINIVIDNRRYQLSQSVVTKVLEEKVSREEEGGERPHNR